MLLHALFACASILCAHLSLHSSARDARELDLTSPEMITQLGKDTPVEKLLADSVKLEQKLQRHIKVKEKWMEKNRKSLEQLQLNKKQLLSRLPVAKSKTALETEQPDTGEAENAQENQEAEEAGFDFDMLTDATHTDTTESGENRVDIQPAPSYSLLSAIGALCTYLIPQRS